MHIPGQVGRPLQVALCMVAVVGFGSSPMHSDGVTMCPRALSPIGLHVAFKREFFASSDHHTFAMKGYSGT